MKFIRNDSGISENIGIILIVSVVVIGAAIVGVTVTSEPAPEEIPNADIIIGCEDAAGGTFNVTLFHNGGDTLMPDDLEVRAYDSGNQPIDIELYEGESTDPFAVSNILTFSTDTKPARISVLYTGGTASAALKSLDIGSTAEDDQAAQESTSVDTTVAPTPTQGGGGEEPTPTQTTVTPTPTSTQVPSPATDIELNTDNGKKGSIREDSYIQFRVTGDYSYITMTGNYEEHFNQDDVVKLVISHQGNSEGYGNIYITTDQISTFAFNHVLVYLNGEFVHNGNIQEIWISDYEDFVSTLTIIVPSKNKLTYFKVDSDVLIDWVYDRRPINVYNLKPGSFGYMILDNAQGRSNIYYKGGAESYEIFS